MTSVYHNSIFLATHVMHSKSLRLQKPSTISWLSNNKFVSGAGDLKLKSPAGQIGHSIANGSPPLRHFFKMSCVAWA